MKKRPAKKKRTTAKKRPSTKRPSGGKNAKKATGKSVKKKRTTKGVSATSNPDGDRLQKVLATAGLGSRRACEELIVAGRVMVDGEIAAELGVKVDPAKQEIRVDGNLLRKPKLVYYLLNKPTGYLSTNSDPTGRERVVDLLPDNERLFTVGRLDRSSEGLILATNDGELANRLAHPRFGIEKVYHVEVVGHPSPQVIKNLRDGVHLAEALVKASSARLKKKRGKSAVLEIKLTEGRNREIRRMLARLGHKVLRLTRVSLGPLKLGQIPTGAYRELTPREVSNLKNLSSIGQQQKAKTSPAARRKAAEEARKTRVKLDRPPRKKKAAGKTSGKKKTVTRRGDGKRR